jgi:hypothetical protein
MLRKETGGWSTRRAAAAAGGGGGGGGVEVCFLESISVLL